MLGGKGVAWRCVERSSRADARSLSSPLFGKRAARHTRRARGAQPRPLGGMPRARVSRLGLAVAAGERGVRGARDCGWAMRRRVVSSGSRCAGQRSSCSSRVRECEPARGGTASLQTGAARRIRIHAAGIAQRACSAGRCAPRSARLAQAWASLVSVKLCHTLPVRELTKSTARDVMVTSRRA